MQNKLITIAENSVALHNKCVQNHYVATVTGSGMNTLSFQVPFNADMVSVLCQDPRCHALGYYMIMFQADLMAMSSVAAMTVAARNGTIVPGISNTTNIDSRCIQADDGTVTVYSGASNCFFAQDLPYLVMATRYTDKTLKERYIELVESLTGSGSLPVCAARVYSVFTQEEWAALIATKPDWTLREV